MIPCLGCERVRDLLEAYVDDELSLSEQVAIEAHVRVCTTCAARVEDLRLIASSLRGGSPLRPTAEDEGALAGIQASTLARVCAERDQAVVTRLREAFADMRLLWPALGAAGAVAVGVGIAYGMLHLAGSGRPESLAAVIHALAERGVVHAAERTDRLGTDDNPMRLGATMFDPQVIDDGVSFATLLEDEAVFASWAVVGSNGRIADYELLGARGTGEAGARRTAREAADVAAAHHALRGLRFAPALAADGSGVAVEMVIMMAKTTATLSRPRPLRAVTVPAPPDPAAVAVPAVPLEDALEPVEPVEPEGERDPRPSESDSRLLPPPARVPWA